MALVIKTGFFLLANAWHLSVSALAPAASWHADCPPPPLPSPQNTEAAKTIKMREQMFFLSSVSLRVCQVLISALTGERDEASLTHAMWVKNPDDFFFLLPVR